MEHSPTPWGLRNDDSHGFSEEPNSVVDSGGLGIIYFAHGFGEAAGDMRHIIKCVNAHDKLVAALRASELWVNEYLDVQFAGGQKRTVYTGKTRSIVDLDNEITIALAQLEELAE